MTAGLCIFAILQVVHSNSSNKALSNLGIGSVAADSLKYLSVVIFPVLVCDSSIVEYFCCFLALIDFGNFFNFKGNNKVFLNLSK